MQFQDNLSGRLPQPHTPAQNNSLEHTPKPTPKPTPSTHRYSEQQPKKSQRGSDAQRLKLTTILESMNPQGMFPKLNKPKPSPPEDQQGKLKLLKLKAYFKKDH